MREERILTLHPEGKQGVNISKDNQRQVRYRQERDYRRFKGKRGTNLLSDGSSCHELSRKS